MSAEIRRFWWLVVLAISLWAVVSSANARGLRYSVQTGFNGGYLGISVDIQSKGYNAANGGIKYVVRALGGYTAPDGHSENPAAKVYVETSPGITIQVVDNGEFYLPLSTQKVKCTGFVNYVFWQAMGPLDEADSWLYNEIERRGKWTAPMATQDVTYKLFDKVTGKNLQTVYVRAGQSVTVDVISPKGNDVGIMGYVENKVWDPGSGQWVDANGTNTNVLNDTIAGKEMWATRDDDQVDTGGEHDVVVTQSEKLAPASGTFIEGNASRVSSRYAIPTDTLANPTAGATNLNTIRAGNVVANSVGGLEQTLDAGLRAVIKQLQQTGAGGGTGGTGGSVNVDMSGVINAVNSGNGKLDLIRNSISAIDEREAVRKTDEDTLRGNNPSQLTMATQGGAASTAATGIINGAGGAAPTVLGYTIPEGSGFADIMKIEMPAAFGGATFDLNPLSRPSLLAIAHWFRSAVQWLALVTLGVWIWQQMAEWVRGFSMIRQASGNAVVGGTGAQATALLAAGLITTAVVVAMTALMSWSFGDIGFAALRSAVGTNPFAGLPVEALGFLSEILPVATLVSCLVARFTFNFYGSSVFAACSAVIRFVVT